jgi:hypothetical protein
MGTRATESYMEYIVFSGICLPYVKAIMVSTCIPSRATILNSDGTDPTLECMLSCARGLLQPCPILPGCKRYHLPRPRRW